MLALGLEDRIVAAAVLDHDVKDEYKEAFSKVNYLEEFTVNEVSSKVSNEEKQSAMVIEFYDDEIYTYGSKTLAGDMVTKLGAEVLNPEGGNIGAGDLIKLNPDCIFVSYMDMGDENIPVEEVNI
ncbi:ABC transporter substrate-binding protein [Clostridium sp. D43t1_170807_H7]|uniref:ABC transporter substrate-binding protein n=1 Tax=Clostridium sp. D43t1_170807_H7 TaxID=2787140 RepID=UPI001897C12D|nr:ABC transporter substrate-binding protein [Clostridium sp. D43t1_170807_H7]